MTKEITVTVNGEVIQLPSGTTVTQLIEKMAFQGRRLAVERNEEIVPKSLHAETALQHQDKLEIVHAIGGG